MKLSTLSLIVFAIMFTATPSTNAAKRRCRHKKGSHPAKTTTRTVTVSSPTPFKFNAAAENPTVPAPSSTSTVVVASPTASPTPRVQPAAPKKKQPENGGRPINGGINGDQQGALQAHNNGRAAVGVQALQWSASLEA